ncbi:hypothetical protein VPH35_024591 [Triticum aestivum]
MALPAIPDELLVDIFLRLPTPGDLIRASAACASFRRLVADRSFLRRFRKIHPPPFLGFLYPGQHRFHPAVRPHPSAPAASAVALAADFSFAFLPAPARNWSVREVRDGRVLLDRSRLRDAGDGLEALFKEMVLCDPLHRRCLLLPPIPDDLAASVVDQLLIEGHCFAETFLVPPSNDDEEAAAATEEEGTSFRVIWMVLFEAKLVAAVFSSGTGKWQTLSRSEPLPGFLLSTWKFWFVSRHYAHGCFYWRMEFSMADHPPGARHSGDDVAIVEAGQGMIRMFVPKSISNSRVKLTPRRKLCLGRHLLLYQCGNSLVKSGGFTLDVNTLQCERVCASLPKPSHIYCNFPSSLLGIGLCQCNGVTLCNAAKPHADVRGEGGAVRVPELQEADPGGVEAHVLAAATQTPNPLFAGGNDAEAGCGGRGGAGDGPPEGAGAGGVAREGVQGGEGRAGTRVSRRTAAAKGNKSFSWRGCLPFWM